MSDAQIRLWSAGDYSTISRHLVPISVETVEAAAVGAGDTVLDVAVGDGNAAIECARRGASVVGIDLTPSQIERARARCAAEGVSVDLRVGDAMALEVEDASFDVVLSVLGVMFAPDPDGAVAEVVRAVRPGGTVALASWKSGGWSNAWRERLAGLLPGAVGPSPTEQWGDADQIGDRLAAAGLEVDVTARPFAWRFGSIDDAVATITATSPPHVTALARAAEVGRRDEVQAAFVDVVTTANEATDGSCSLPAPWLLAVAHRRSRG